MKMFLSVLAVALAAQISAQDVDPAVMRINGHDVLSSEFKYYFNKNRDQQLSEGQMTPQEYAPLFIAYKLKVEAAKDAKLDTTQAFQAEYLGYRNQLVRNSFVSPQAEEAEAREYYENMKRIIGSEGLVKPAHIFVGLRQNASLEEQKKAKERIDSLYTELKNGADFAQMALKYSDDKASAIKGGELPWIAKNQTVKEFEDMTFRMQKGEISEPFQSVMGYHIVKIKDKKQLEPFEDLKQNLLRELEQQGMKERLAKVVIDSLLQEQGAPSTLEELMDREAERLAQSSFDMKYLMQEYHDGLLLYDLCSKEIWQKAATDTVGLEDYFKKNKKKYRWDEPRYNGALYFCRSQDMVKKVASALKRKPENEWLKIIKDEFNSDSLQVRVTQKVFKKGENKYVDYLAFRSQKKPVELRSFKSYGLKGRKLKKGPKYWYDAQAAVIADYQTFKEKEYVDELKKRYEVIVFNDVLDTLK